MGLVLDSGALIGAERERRPVSELLAVLEREHGQTEIALSSISVIELEHGLHRALTAEQSRRRREYLDSAFAAIPVYSFTVGMVRIAAAVDAETQSRGQTIPFADLLIGATALRFGFAIGTRNLRHFQMIPDLQIVRL